MNEKLTLGSLFDGSGGFPLGGLLCGIEPRWAAEIEPFPIRVTTKRLPMMKHLGDISTVNGAEIDPVDIITFGSPCTDMSVAGRRAGLDGKQSHLFYEAIRIIKEMRGATNGRYPRYIVWENVVGAYSSNKGEDFRSVLEAVIGVVEPGTEVPPPEKNQWPYADCYMGDGWSVAYRTLDAQHWGVPQRRKRIYLVADFGGQCAGKVLFESEGVSGYSAESFRSWQRAAGSTADCAGATVCEPIALENHPADSRVKISEDGCVQTLTSRCGTGGGNVPLLLDIPVTLKIRSGCEGGGKEEKNGPQGNGVNEDVSFTLNTVDKHAVAYSTSKTQFHTIAEKELANTLVASDYKDPPVVNTPISETEYIVRRLTPTECARLQGFPDWWCSNLGTENPTEADMVFWREVFETHRKIMGSTSKPKSDSQILKWLKDPHSDSAEYKMWGNGVALSCVYFVLSGVAYYTQNSQKMIV